MASLKEKQREAILTFLSGRDTFVVLLTGYGKSLIYAMLPLVFDKLKGTYVVERDSQDILLIVHSSYGTPTPPKV